MATFLFVARSITEVSIEADSRQEAWAKYLDWHFDASEDGPPKGSDRTVIIDGCEVKITFGEARLGRPDPSLPMPSSCDGAFN